MLVIGYDGAGAVKCSERATAIAVLASFGSARQAVIRQRPPAPCSEEMATATSISVWRQPGNWIQARCSWSGRGPASIDGRGHSERLVYSVARETVDVPSHHDAGRAQLAKLCCAARDAAIASDTSIVRRVVTDDGDEGAEGTDDVVSRHSPCRRVTEGAAVRGVGPTEHCGGDGPAVRSGRWASRRRAGCPARVLRAAADRRGSSNYCDQRRRAKRSDTSHGIKDARRTAKVASRSSSAAAHKCRYRAPSPAPYRPAAPLRSRLNGIPSAAAEAGVRRPHWASRPRRG